MTTRLVSVVIDSADPARLADWWGAALGWPVDYHPCESGVGPPREPQALRALRAST